MEVILEKLAQKSGSEEMQRLKMEYRQSYSRHNAVQSGWAGKTDREAEKKGREKEGWRRGGGGRS